MSRQSLAVAFFLRRRRAGPQPVRPREMSLLFRTIEHPLHVRDLLRCRSPHECVETRQNIVVRNVRLGERPHLLRDVAPVDRPEANTARLELLVKRSAPLVDPAVAWMQANRVQPPAHFVLRQQDPDRLKARKRNVSAQPICRLLCNPVKVTSSI